MGWAYCGHDDLGRGIGYGVSATCDKRGCKEKIDRGLGCVCGDMHGGGEYGCGRYFCGKHLEYLWWDLPNSHGGYCGKCADVLEEAWAPCPHGQPTRDGIEHLC